MQESYEEMKKALADICKDVENLHSFEIDKQKVDIVFYLAGDWKFLGFGDRLVHNYNNCRECIQ